LHSVNAKWDQRYLGLARHVAGWSKDPSTQVGAVIVDWHKRVVSLGFNGPPRNVQDSERRLHDRDVKYRITLHAEENAILFANRALHGCTIYTWPLPPCAKCASKIIQVGLNRVVAPPLPADLEERWERDIQLGRQLFDEAGIVFEELSHAT
jgi:dCMP deaminase